MRALWFAILLIWASWARAQIFCIEDHNGHPYRGPVIVQNYGIVNLDGTIDVDLMSWASERCARWLRPLPIPEIWTLIVPTDGNTPTMVFDLPSSANGLQVLRLARPSWRMEDWHLLKPHRIVGADGRPLKGARMLVTGTKMLAYSDRKGRVMDSRVLCEEDAEIIVVHSCYNAQVLPADWQRRITDPVETTDIVMDFPAYGGILIDADMGHGDIVSPDDQLLSGYLQGRAGLYYIQFTDGATQAVYDLVFYPMIEMLHAPSVSDRLSLSLKPTKYRERVQWALDQGDFPPVSAKVGSLISRQAVNPKHPLLTPVRMWFAQWRLRVFTPVRMIVLGALLGGAALLWFPRKHWLKLFRRIRRVSTKPSTPPSFFPSA